MVVSMDAPFAVVDGIGVRLVGVGTDKQNVRREPQLRIDLAAVRSARTDQMDRDYATRFEQWAALDQESREETGPPIMPGESVLKALIPVLLLQTGDELLPWRGAFAGTGTERAASWWFEITCQLRAASCHVFAQPRSPSATPQQPVDLVLPVVAA